MKQVTVISEGQMEAAEELSFKSVKELWAEYAIEDGATIKMKHVVSRVFRVLSKTKPDGTPFYVVEGTAVFTVINPGAVTNSVCEQREEEKAEVIPMTSASPIPAAPYTQTIFPVLGMAESISADFSSVPGVREVQVSRDRDRFTVEVILSSFRKDVRRKLYAKQRGFQRGFPSFELLLHFIYASGSARAPDKCSRVTST